jgi:predicted Zn-dependent protease
MENSTLLFSLLTIVVLGLITFQPLRAGAATTSHSIDLITCQDGEVAKWKGNNTVKYKIDNVADLRSKVEDAVRTGIEEWNTVQSVYDLRETRDNDADITISLYDKIIPKFVLGATHVDCASAENGIQKATIVLGLRGLSITGVKNVAAHEMGHALGLGHSNTKTDLVYFSFDDKERKSVFCPSNLDVKALSAESTPYEAPTWTRLDC